MSAPAVIAPARPGTHTEPAHCNCGDTLDTPYERRNHTCFECEQLDQAMACAVCEEHVAVAYCDGRPTFCSTSCEEDLLGLPRHRPLDHHSNDPEPAR